MSDELTLPGDIPGLLRRGSPVVDLDDDAGFCGTWLGRHQDNHAIAHMPAGGVGNPRIFFALTVGLDLRDATGRAHAAWWLAGRTGAATTARFRLRWTRPVDKSRTRWTGREWDMGASTFAPSATLSHVTVVSTLAHLDPDDPRLLPDGSRRVDAEALRLVVLHVAGRPK